MRAAIAADPRVAARVEIDLMYCHYRGAHTRVINLYKRRDDGAVTDLALAMDGGRTKHRARIELFNDTDACPVCAYVLDNVPEGTVLESERGQAVVELSWKRVPALVWGAVRSLGAP
jgi:hypothetical protein